MIVWFAYMFLPVNKLGVRCFAFHTKSVESVYVFRRSEEKQGSRMYDLTN
jgi:hypothetical protein